MKFELFCLHFPKIEKRKNCGQRFWNTKRQPPTITDTRRPIYGVLKCLHWVRCCPFLSAPSSIPLSMDELHRRTLPISFSQWTPMNLFWFIWKVEWTLCKTPLNFNFLRTISNNRTLREVCKKRQEALSQIFISLSNNSTMTEGLGQSQSNSEFLMSNFALKIYLFRN